jgi:protein SCO1
MTGRARFAAGLVFGTAVALAVAPAWASFYGKHRGPLPAVGGEGPAAAANIDTIENLGQRVPRALGFVDGHGRKVALDALLNQGKPVLLTLGYYRCPMLCNLVHEGLVKAVRASGLVLGRDFQGLAVSIDPKEDPKSAATNEGRLLRALERPGQQRDWPFVIDPTADTSAVRALADSVGFRYKYDEKSKQFAHAAVAVVLTSAGVVSRYIYGVDFAARDLRFAMVEASGGRVGTTLDRVLLTCFKYDPMVQRYTPYAFGFMRIGALASFAALSTLLAVLWRRELTMRRRKGR